MTRWPGVPPVFAFLLFLPRARSGKGSEESTSSGVCVWTEDSSSLDDLPRHWDHDVSERKRCCTLHALREEEWETAQEGPAWLSFVYFQTQFTLILFPIPQRNTEGPGTTFGSPQGLQSYNSYLPGYLGRTWTELSRGE